MRLLMAIANFPENLQKLIQLGFLERRFQEALSAEMGYRDICEKKPFATQIGQSLTETRYGRIGPKLTPIDPTTNNNLDSGLTTGKTWQVEQYTYNLNQYGDRIEPDLNIVADTTALASQFMVNVENLAYSAKLSLEIKARDALLDGYLRGQSRITETLLAPSNTIKVDDIRGLNEVWVANAQNFVPANKGPGFVPVSPTNPLAITIGTGPGAIANEVVGFVADSPNVSTAESVGGISGTLTLLNPVPVEIGTLGTPVISAFAPRIIRPNGRASTFNLTTGDTLSLSSIRAAVTYLSLNAIPRMNDGYYHCIMDAGSQEQLYSDPEFQFLYRGTQFSSDTYKNYTLVPGLGVKFIIVNTTPQQTLTNSNDTVIDVRRPFICGRSVIKECYYQGMNAIEKEEFRSPLIDVKVIDQIRFITRDPIDRLGQAISQAYSFIGDWVTPTDITINGTVIPTAGNAYTRRGVFIETIG